MRAHYPKGRLLPALERNILKYRALEMVIILFEVEHLKEFVVAAVQGRKFVIPLSFNRLLFEAADKTYEQELRRLHRKIVRQLAMREKQIEGLNRELSSENADTASFFPLYKKRNGTLTTQGIEICYRLFDRDRSTLAVAHFLRISYRAAARRRRAWERAGGKSRSAPTGLAS
jgi:hypothetical protein